MSFKWVTAGDLKKQVAAKDTEIATLKQQLEVKQEANSGLANLTALFGDAAKAEDFDLEAAISGLITQTDELDATNEKLEKQLDANVKALAEANTKLDAAAKMLGHESAKDIDLAAEIGKIEPEGKTNPIPGQKREPGATSDAEFRSEIDDQIAAELKKAGINVN